MTNKEEIAKLKQELADQKAKVEALEAAQPKPAPKGSRPLTKEEQDAWSREMDALRHRNESFVPPWLREACAGGVSDRDARAIAGAARAPTGPTTMAPSSPPVTARSGGGGVPGGGTGWSREIPIGPSMHQRYVDAQLDAADARDKAERVREQAQLRAADRLDALAKIVEGKK
jgi:hypothetical protein